MQQITSFLDEFTKELIENYSRLFLDARNVAQTMPFSASYISEHPEIPNKPYHLGHDKQNEFFEREIVLEKEEARPAKSAMPQMPPAQQLRQAFPIMPQPVLHPYKPLTHLPPAQKPMPLQQQKYQPSSSILIPTGKLGFDKLIQLLGDASVTRIEYQAGNKPLLITRFGQTFPSKIIISEPEAMEVLEEFSKQAKIPLVKGIFRVGIRNLMVFAVVSDFIKPRFVVQKTREF